MDKKSIFCVVMTAFCFGTMEAASKLGGLSFNAIQLVFLRFAIGGILLLPFAIADLRKRECRLMASDIVYLFVLGIVCIGSMALMQIGLRSINANVASIIISMNPLFTMIFARFIVGEAFTRRKALVLLISFIGLIIVINPKNLIAGGINAQGLLITLLAAAAFGLYTALGKRRLAKIGGMAQNCLTFLFGDVALLIVMLCTGIPVVEGITLQSLPVMLYLGIVVTAAGYFFFVKAIALSGPSNASIAFFIKPVLAPIVALIVLKEPITINFVIGVVFILIGSYLKMIPEKPAKEATAHVHA